MASANYIFRQVAALQREVGRFERKYGMRFQQFSQYLQERLKTSASRHERLVDAYEHPRLQLFFQKRVIAMDLIFEWDEGKATTTLKKHKISFEEAKTVFSDPLQITFPDPDHSATEQRWLSIGLSSKGRVLIVSHTDRAGHIRLISCRKATASERRAYEEGAFPN